MAPNLKHPENLQQFLAVNKDLLPPALETAAPAHAAPLATAADVMPPATNNNNDIRGYDGGDYDDYFYHDIEAEQDTAADAPTKEKARVDHNPKYHQERNLVVEEDDETRMVRSVLRRFSTIVQNPEEFTIDEKRLYHAVRDEGMHTYGLQGIAVWIFDEDHHRLVSPPGGFWYNPDNTTPSEALDGLADKARSDHVPMVPVAPGTDIAGLLWLEASNQHHHLRHHWVLSFMQRATSMTNLAPSRGQSTNSLSGIVTNDQKSAALTWRDLKSLVQDPDTAKGPRLALLEQAGFGQATAIQFHSGVFTGMVIFFVQNNLDMEILNGTANVSYLHQSAQFIGTAAAMSEARRATKGQMALLNNKKKVTPVDDIEQQDDHDHQPPKTGQEEERKDGDVDEKEESPRNPSAAPSSCHVLKAIQVWLSKIQGGGLQIPPALSFRQALWTAFGAFCGLLVLSSLNEYYMTLSDDDYFLLIGPFGALMTLQYGLTAAPASQPRNAVMGQAVAGAVSLAFTYIPEEILPTWLRRAVGPAIGIATMVKFGFTHPPAGAHAVLYASGKYNFAFYALVVFSTVISIIPATLVNNMSRKRQYPTYWGVPSFLSDKARLLGHKSCQGKV